MAVTTILTKQTATLIYDLINDANEIDIDASILSLSAPTVLSGDATGKNTSVVGTPLPGSGYKNTVRLTYDRLDMTVLLQKLVKQVVVPNLTQTTDVLSAFNEKYGFLLVAGDIVNESITSTGGTQSITVTMADSCPAFIGTFELTVSPS
nr:MAG: hypothetical protein [Bacteriophage sp.]